MTAAAREAAVAREPRAPGAGRYSLVAIVLHWLIAAGIVLQVTLSLRMQGPNTPLHFAVTQLHKSVGITILMLSLVRLGWRLANPPAPLPVAMPAWERGLARVVHVGFYVVIIAMPLTGWLMVSASRIQIPTLLYGLVPWPSVPGVAHLAAPAKAFWHEVGETGHATIAYLIYVLLAVHVAGALKHQLFSSDEPVLARMAPGARAGRWLEPRLALIIAAVLGVIAFGWLVTPPTPGMSPRPHAPAALAPAEPAAVRSLAPGPSAAAPHETAAAPHETAAAPAPAAPGLAAPPAAAPVRWIVEPGSTLGFRTAWSGQPLTGRFETWRADILFSPDALDRSRVTVTIDVASADTGDRQRDAALSTDDWFGAAAHPQAVFEARRFQKTGEDRFLAHGRLTLRGVSRPIDLPFRLHIVGDRAEVSGVTSLDRTVFGVGQGEWQSTDQIPAKVSVTVNLKARRG